MSQHIFILSNPATKSVAEDISRQIFVNGIIEADELTEAVLNQMVKNCQTEYFYVITTDQQIYFRNFDFSFKPPEWDKEYVHIWNNDRTVRLFNKKIVQENIGNFTDASLLAGKISVKNTDIPIFEYPVFDIVFLSYDEHDADTQFRKLKSRFPRIQRVHNVKGIFEAHKAAAKLSKTGMVYIVDADADILPSFNFDYHPSAYDRDSVHIWHSRNPVNDLEYGYGAVKLFPTNLLLEYKGSPVDFTTSVSSSVKVIPEVSNITRFNTDPFSTWRSAFRECAKLASKSITNQIDKETTERLVAWTCKGGDREFGDFAMQGAVEGRRFGYLNKDQPELLRLINDFSWLEKQFSA
jgi:hypothetical protein